MADKGLQYTSLRNKFGEFEVHELVTPGCDFRSDILAVTRADVVDDIPCDMELVAYTYGAAMMNADDVMMFFYNAIAEYIAEHATTEELRDAIKNMCKNEDGWLLYSWEKG